jgi:adenosylmethionine-8-amino-7-oxononanoate aminotransferase
VPPPAGYLQAVRAVCDRHGVLLIADEVMCGSGRCGSWSAMAGEGIDADILAVGKGVAGGYIPLAATIICREVGAAIQAAHGGLLTGHTYSGHTAACAAGLAVQRLIQREALVPRVRSRGAALLTELKGALAGMPQVGDVRGRGFFIGVELVRDPDSRDPFAPELAVSQRIARHAFGDGLIVYPCAGHVAGIAGDTIVIAPPYNASEPELAELIEKLTRAIAAVLSAR